MDIKIKIEAVVAGLLAVRDKYIFTVMGHSIAVSPLGDIADTHFILFDSDGFFIGVLSQRRIRRIMPRLW